MGEQALRSARNEIEGIAALFQDFCDTAGHEVLGVPRKDESFLGWVCRQDSVSNESAFTLDVLQSILLFLSICIYILKYKIEGYACICARYYFYIGWFAHKSRPEFCKPTHLYRYLHILIPSSGSSMYRAG